MREGVHTKAETVSLEAMMHGGIFHPLLNTPSPMNEADLILRIEKFKAAVQAWCEERGLWDHAEFKDWLEYHDDEPPEYPCAAFLVSDGPLAEAWNGYHGHEDYDGFNELIENLGFGRELQNSYSANFYLPDNDKAIETLSSIYEWKWICNLLKPDFSALYGEIFERFLKRPDDLRRIEPRQFEILLDGIFKNNGYRTELGRGSGDGGVDIRIYHNDVVGEALTLVQAKQYAPHRPIGLEAVQALSGAVEDEKANRGLFVTTSRYLPGSQNFANRQNQRLQLAQTEDILKWTESAQLRINRDKSHWISREHVTSTLSKHTLSPLNGLEGVVFHATYGYDCTRNLYAIVLKESNGAVLMMELPNINVSGDDQDGYDIPALGPSSLINHNADGVFRAIKQTSIDGRIRLWGKQHLFHIWSGWSVPLKNWTGNKLDSGLRFRHSIRKGGPHV
jgi:hypothetical protein